MYKKVENPKRSWNCIPVFVDGLEYPSLFSACVDFEIGYPNAHSQMKKHKGEPFEVSGHQIVLKDYLVQHPDFELKTKELKK